MKSKSRAGKLPLVEAPTTSWEQLNLPFDHEVILRQTIDDVLLTVPESNSQEDGAITSGLQHVLCSAEAVADLAASVGLSLGSDDLRFRNRKVLEKLRSAGGRVRRLRRLPDGWRSDLKSLLHGFPNFSEVLMHVGAMGALAELGDGVLRMDASLLDGPPGTGKSTFVEHLAQIVAGGFLRVCMSSAETGAQLGGSAASWSNSQTGAVFDCLFTGNYANPLVLLDEIDKSPSDPGVRYSPVGPLYTLLEPPMARVFRDLSLPMLAIDASAVLWMSTSNDRQLLPEPILSRLQAFDIEAPAPELAVQVVHSVLRKMAQEEPTLSRFTLAADAALKLSKHMPRTARGLLRRACGNAAQSSRWAVQADDVPDAVTKRHPVGFVA